MGWSTVARRVVYENPWIRVREDDVVRPDGTAGLYGVVELRSPAVFVVAITAAGKIVLLRVDRYPTGTASWEIPAGGSDGEPPLIAAQRELREETGLLAGRWQELGPVHSLNGVADAPGTVFLARELAEADGARTDLAAESRAEGITARRDVTWGELGTMIGNGEITDNESLGALLLAAVVLGRLRV